MPGNVSVSETAPSGPQLKRARARAKVSMTGMLPGEARRGGLQPEHLPRRLCAFSTEPVRIKLVALSSGRQLAPTYRFAIAGNFVGGALVFWSDMAKYRIIDVTIDRPEVFVEAKSPEAAALTALGIELVRSGSRQALRARVYWQNNAGDPMNMVRLYGKVADA